MKDGFLVCEAEKGIRTLNPSLGKAILYHWAISAFFLRTLLHTYVRKTCLVIVTCRMKAREQRRWSERTEERVSKAIVTWTYLEWYWNIPSVGFKEKINRCFFLEKPSESLLAIRYQEELHFLSVWAVKYQEEMCVPSVRGLKFKRVLGVLSARPACLLIRPYVRNIPNVLKSAAETETYIFFYGKQSKWKVSFHHMHIFDRIFESHARMHFPVTLSKKRTLLQLWRRWEKKPFRSMR